MTGVVFVKGGGLGLNAAQTQRKTSAYCVRQKKHQKAKVSVSQSCPTLCDLMDSLSPGSSVRGILQARHWRGLPFPSPGDLPDSGIEPVSPAQSPAQAGRFFASEPPGKPNC